jgi:hypothetical protein
MALPHYSILDLSPPIWRSVADETGGTKKKFWAEDAGGRRVLFKFRRGSATGDDWAEKIAAEIAELLGIPHAACELAVYRGEQGSIERGIASFDFNERGRLGLFVPGNELLLEVDPTYPREERYHVAAHTVDKVLSVLRLPFIRSPDLQESQVPAGDAVELFLGYLMLDSLISNQDRHHENWGVLQKLVQRPSVMPVPRNMAFPFPTVKRTATLAPTFDHASSLGWNLTDDERHSRLHSRDRSQDIRAFARKAKSALYGSPADRKPLSPLKAFRLAAERCQAAKDGWLAIARTLSEVRVWEILERVPEEVMSPVSKTFALEIVKANLQNLLETENQ